MVFFFPQLAQKEELNSSLPLSFIHSFNLAPKKKKPLAVPETLRTGGGPTYFYLQRGEKLRSCGGNTWKDECWGVEWGCSTREGKSFASLIDDRKTGSWGIRVPILSSRGLGCPVQLSGVHLNWNSNLRQTFTHIFIWYSFPPNLYAHKILCDLMALIKVCREINQIRWGYFPHALLSGSEILSLCRIHTEKLSFDPLTQLWGISGKVLPSVTCPWETQEKKGVKVQVPWPGIRLVGHLHSFTAWSDPGPRSSSLVLLEMKNRGLG